MIPNVVCVNCNKEIYRRPYAIKHHKIFFCSNNCSKEFHSKKSKIIKVNCNYCKKEIARTSVQQRRSKTGLFFCNNLCKNRYLAKNKRWKKAKDNVFHHRSRQEILLKKVNYTCQKCGYNEDRRMLDIHHYDHVHKNNRYNNLRVLCVWCHVKHHRLKEEYILPEIISDKEMDKEIKLFIEEKIKINTDKIRKKARKLLIKICLICQKEFKTKHQKQKYCSCECSGLANRKIKRPDKENLLYLINTMPMTTIGRKFKVSDNAIRKWAKKYDINIKDIKKKQGYNSMVRIYSL